MKISDILEVTCDFSKAVSQYIKDVFQIKNGACLTTKIIYTKSDFYTLANENFFKDFDLQKQRLENFLYINALEYFNPERVVEYVASTKQLDDGILILPSRIIKEIIYNIGTESPNNLENLMVDCIMCTVKNIKGVYIIVIDYLSFI